MLLALAVRCVQAQAVDTHQPWRTEEQSERCMLPNSRARQLARYWQRSPPSVVGCPFGGNGKRCNQERPRAV